MIQDTARLSNDLQSMFTTLYPEADNMKLNIRLEEILSNYDNKRKEAIDIEKDIEEKIILFISAKKLEGLSEITLKNYQIELNVFARCQNKASSQITTSDVRLYLASMHYWKISTLSTRLSTLKSFFGWLVREEIILRDPTAKIPIPKKAQRIPKGLSIDELELIRESCNTLRQRAVMEILYSTGCRLGELIKMNMEDVNYQDMSMRVIGKGNKERIVYLTAKAIYHLKKYLDSRVDDVNSLFITERKPYRRMGSRAIQREVDIVGNLANLSNKLTPHVYRHSYASLSMDHGIDLADLQHLLGHSNPSTTLIYANVSEERKRMAFKKHHVQ